MAGRARASPRDYSRRPAIKTAQMRRREETIAIAINDL
jgi:hypothetical protein